MDGNKLFLILILALGRIAPAFAELPHIDLEFSAAHDSNISRAESKPSIKSDNIATFGAAATRSIVLSPNSGMLLSGGLQLSEYAHYNRLSHLSASLGAIYRVQPLVAYTAPWLELGGKLEHMVYRDSDIRDGTVLDAHASVGKRFTDRIRAQAGFGWDHRWAEEGNVYELTHRRLFLLADYKLNGSATLYSNWSRDFGDQVVASIPEPALLAFSRASAASEAFPGLNVYRIGSIANIYGIGTSVAFSSTNTLDVGVQRFQIDSDGGGAYDGTELRASWLYRFQ